MVVTRLTGMKTFVGSIHRKAGDFSFKEFLSDSEARCFGISDSTITKIVKRNEFNKEIVIYLKDKSSHPTYENITKIEDTCFDRCSLCGACVAYMDYDRDNSLNLHTKWHVDNKVSFGIRGTDANMMDSSGREGTIYEEAKTPSELWHPDEEEPIDLLEDTTMDDPGPFTWVIVNVAGEEIAKGVKECTQYALNLDNDDYCFYMYDKFDNEVMSFESIQARAFFRDIITLRD